MQYQIYDEYIRDLERQKQDEIMKVRQAGGWDARMAGLHLVGRCTCLPRVPHAVAVGRLAMRLVSADRTPHHLPSHALFECAPRALSLALCPRLHNSHVHSCMSLHLPAHAPLLPPRLHSRPQNRHMNTRAFPTTPVLPPFPSLPLQSKGSKPKAPAPGDAGGAASGRPQSARPQARSANGEVDLLQSPSMPKAALILDRMANQNMYEEIAMDFKYWEDASDAFRCVERGEAELEGGGLCEGQ